MPRFSFDPLQARPRAGILCASVVAQSGAERHRYRPLRPHVHAAAWHEYRRTMHVQLAEDVVALSGRAWRVTGRLCCEATSGHTKRISTHTNTPNRSPHPLCSLLCSSHSVGKRVPRSTSSSLQGSHALARFYCTRWNSQPFRRLLATPRARTSSLASKKRTMKSSFSSATAKGPWAVYGEGGSVC